jgi:hypothetical protein
MHTKHEPDDPEVLKSMGYDRRDLDVPEIKRWTTIITVFCFACFFVSVPIYNYLTTPPGGLWEKMWGHNRAPDDKTKIRMSKETPVLQDNITTKIDIEEMRRDERTRMESPAWINKDKGVVRIPVDRAIDLVAQRGVSTGNEVAAKVEGTTIKQNAVGPGSSGN